MERLQIGNIKLSQFNITLIGKHMSLKQTHLLHLLIRRIVDLLFAVLLLRALVHAVIIPIFLGNAAGPLAVLNFLDVIIAKAASDILALLLLHVRNAFAILADIAAIQATAALLLSSLRQRILVGNRMAFFFLDLVKLVNAALPSAVF